MIILVDIDNILNNFTETCLQMYNNYNGTFYQLSDIVQYDISKSLNLPNPEQFNHDYLISSNLVNMCEPLNDAIYYLEKLNKKHAIYLVTSRDWKQLININEWIGNFYPFIMDRQIIRCQDKSQVRGDVLIDDCLDNLYNFPGGRIVFDYPWNQNPVESEHEVANCQDLTHFIFRVQNWKHCYQTIQLMTG